jgi:hypothetical protein
MPIASTRAPSPPDSHGSRMESSTGETNADEPARITMRPTAAGTFPRAIAVNGGP